MTALLKVTVLALLFSTIPLFYAACPEDDVTISFSQPTYEVQEREGSAVPEIVLSAPVDCCTTISVWVNIKELTAGSEDINVKDSAVRVLIPGGHTSVMLDVMLRDDVVLEGSEKFSVSIDPLSLPYGVAFGDLPTAEVVIMDDDEAIVSFVEPQFDCSEEDGGVTLKFALDQPVPFNGTSVSIRSIDDSITGRCDYQAPSYDVPIPADVEMFTFDFPVIDDDVYEKDESFSLQITSTSNPQIVIDGRNQVARINIADNENLINVSFTNASFMAREDEDIVTVELSLTKPSPCCLQVVVEVEDGSAIGGGVDYGTPGVTQYVVEFPAGTTCSQVEIPIINNNVSEDDNKSFRIVILSDSLPFGIGFGDDSSTDVTIKDDDIYLSFSNETYYTYEDEELCVKLKLNKASDEEIIVYLNDISVNATRVEDYEPGLKNATFAPGETNASVCINLRDDMRLEDDKSFLLNINRSELPSYIVVVSPSSTTVHIQDDEYVIKFDQRVYVVSEDDGFLDVSVSFSKPLRFDTTVKFDYRPLTLFLYGNDSNVTADQIDVYYGPSNYTAEMGTDYFSLRITIVADSRLETSELLSILIVEPVMPYDELGDPISPPQTDIIIIDDDDLILGFEDKNYSVSDKNIPDEPVIKFMRYPRDLNGMVRFPINVTVIEDDKTAVGSNLINHGDYRKQNYSYSFKDEHDEFKLTLYPVDDDLVESDEYYYLNITLLDEPDEIDRIILSNYQVKVTIFNDDVSSVMIKENNGQDFLHFSKRLATNVTANITYENGSNETVGFPAEDVVDYLLSSDYKSIDVLVPKEFRSEKLDNVIVKEGYENVLSVTFI